MTGPLGAIGRFLERGYEKIHQALLWEAWPSRLFYTPVFLYYFYLAARYRSITLPTAANPGIYTGGIIGESKIELIDRLVATGPEFVAEGRLIPGTTFEKRLEALEDALEILGIHVPFVLKPDRGQGGIGVQIIHTMQQVEEYLKWTPVDLVLQRYIPGPYEAAVFYYRFPGESRGRILDITDKYFPAVEGDGMRTLEELIWMGERTRRFASQYLDQLGDRRNQIPARGTKVRIANRGNYVQGCIFLDGERLRSEGLERRINAISRQIDGFYIGRYDIRYQNEADFMSGTEFKIVELNGAGAEPTSFMDPGTSVWMAWRKLCRVLDLLFKIGAKNRRRGCVPMSTKKLQEAILRAAKEIELFQDHEK